MDSLQQTIVKPEEDVASTKAQLSSHPTLPRLQSVMESAIHGSDQDLPFPPHMGGRRDLLSPPIPPNLGSDGQVDSESRPLNVKDALSYLDAVKKQFEDNPDVYNNFLDIMKDFKSQAIETPGVIERVSTLFRGHSDLIQGFNTFLPPGYRIDCTTEAMETFITVTTPSGVTTQQQQSSGKLFANDVTLHSPLPTPATVQPLAPLPALIGPGSRADTPLATSGSPMPFGSSNAANWLGGLGGKGLPNGQGQSGPVVAEEFHHAINYVNKIKTRFEDDPDTYKQFLDILHAYRKEQNHEDVYAQVYSQVQVLFKDAPDLLAEFKVFLPAGGGHGAGSGFAGALPQFSDGGWQEEHIKKPSKAEAVPPTKRKKRVDKDPVSTPQTIAPAAKGTSGRAKKAKHSHKPEPPSPTFQQYPSRAPTPSHAHGHPHVHGHSTHAPGHGHGSHHHAMSLSQQTAAQHASLTQEVTPADEIAFFDRAKKFLESRDVYDEWLKLLNLFTRDVIDARTLMVRAPIFLSDPDLYQQFKEVMRWDEKMGPPEEDGPPGSVRNWSGDWISRGGLDKEERFGKSYRRLPLAETQLACSGRDELCRSVLNDEWVSHPTWASEESGFVSHKKNSYEEALHKSEEERHEFQFYIDIITRTIALMQPIADRIAEMSADEKHSFRLPVDFGGPSKSIYHRAIKKVYGRDSAGAEVLQALQECPAIAIPVVLPRLKQKNEEWRRAQRDWNRVWREVDARNFYKSLDHQGITFKANDKKYITTKSFVAEIETAKNEMLEKAEKVKERLAQEGKRVQSDAWMSSLPCHLEFQFKDISVLQDALKLIFSFLDRSPISYTTQERRTVERMLRSFIPLFCMLPASDFDCVFGPSIDGDGTDGEEANEEGAGGSGSAEESEETHGTASKSHGKSGGSSGRRSAGGSHGGNSNSNGGGVHPSDLRKKLLKTAQEKAAKAKARSGSASVSRAPSPSPTASEDGPGPSTTQNQKEAGQSPSPTPKRKRGAKSKAMDDSVRRGECEEWVKLMPVSYDAGTGTGAEGQDDKMNTESNAEEDVVSKLGKHGTIDQRPFFMNTTFYSLLRLLQLLYSRLLLCKEIGLQLAGQEMKDSVFTVNPIADQLGLVDSSGPRAILAVAASIPMPATPAGEGADSDGMAVDTPSVPNSGPMMTSGAGKGANDATIDTGVVNMAAPPAEEAKDDSGCASILHGRPEAHFYGYLLDACEKLFEGDMDQAMFEENTRFLFGTRAYNVFTLDKLIAALIKQVQTVVVDSKCQELLALLTKARAKHSSGTSTTVREVIAYRREAEQYLGQDEHLYRVEWVQEERLMRIWLLGPEDPSIDIEMSPMNLSSASASSRDQKAAKAETGRGAEVARWRAYMESYVLQHPTELVSEGLRGRMQRTYLNRTREESEGDEPAASNTGASKTEGPERGVLEAGIEVGIQPGSYKLVYRDGTEDLFVSSQRWRVTSPGEQERAEGMARAQKEERARRATNWLERAVTARDEVEMLDEEADEEED